MSRRSGQLAREEGEEFEAYVERHHLQALRLGIVAGPVDHNEPHGKIIDGKWEMVAAGVADYTGVLYNGVGTTLATEAKSRRERLYRREIEPKQQRHLDLVVRGGGLAFLLARLSGVPHAVPWCEVPWKVVRSAESVTAEDLASWAIPEGCACYLERFCPVRGVPAPGIAGGQRRRFPRE